MGAADTALPVLEVLPALRAALGAHPSQVLVAPPGAGKTTGLPQRLLDEDWSRGGVLWMLVPRRLAARAAAARIAAGLGETAGGLVGWSVRFERKTSAATRLDIMTPGVFLRRVLANPELPGVAGLLFDEVHERSLDCDLALALARDVQKGLRPDLRLLAMSATLDGARVAGLLGAPEPILSAGRAFPVETRHVARDAALDPAEQAARLAAQLARETPEGDILVFLPGVAEIRRAIADLEGRPAPGLRAVGLHGGLEPAEQDAVLRPDPDGMRRAIFATSIAETSLTVPGVRIVIDSGLSRRPAYEPDSGLTRLVTVRASKAAAIQRRGRAGRTAPGLCVRMWREAEAGASPDHDRPEILDADLSALALNLAEWGVSDPGMLDWLDPPPAPAWAEARKLLAGLGALDDDGRLTAHGRAMAGFGLPPRLSHMIQVAAGTGLADTAAHVALLLGERGLGGPGPDLGERLGRWMQDRSPRAQAARRQAEAWARQAGHGDHGGHGGHGGGMRVDPDQAGAMLALAFPERVAKARDRRGGFLMAGGRGAELPADSPLAGAPFLAVGAVTGSAGHSRILDAAALTRADIDLWFAARMETRVLATIDPATGQARGRRQTRLGALVLEEGPAPLDPGAAAEALLAHVRRQGIALLDWSPAATRLRARVDWLREQEPEAGWPAMDDSALSADLDDWLGPELRAHARLDRVDLQAALMRRLDGRQSARFETAAPASFASPAGSSHPIDYAAGQGPSVSLRVQEVYGVSRHPVLAAGVPLTFCLLSPGQRPIAITSDLPAFWAGAWADVRKDMKARYPKHVWPEAPAAAAPTLRAKPRGGGQGMR